MTQADDVMTGAAFGVLKAAMQKDSAYAWVWHWNIAMSAYDEGCDYWVANQVAARFMRMVFEIDTADSPEYRDIQEKFAPEYRDIQEKFVC